MGLLVFAGFTFGRRRYRGNVTPKGKRGLTPYYALDRSCEGSIACFRSDIAN